MRRGAGMSFTSIDPWKGTKSDEKVRAASLDVAVQKQRCDEGRGYSRETEDYIHPCIESGSEVRL